MEYIKVKWKYAMPDDPVWLYSEIGDDRFEIRKIDIYADGRIGYAGAIESFGGTELGIVPVPSLTEIASNPEFELMEITKEEFEHIWRSRKTP